MPEKPSIILVQPQMGENIGATARAMMNCDLQDLRLVAPRDGWPNERAVAMSAGALPLMPPVQVFDTTKDAVADHHYVYATTARTRDMQKSVLTARQAAEDMAKRINEGQSVSVLFGPERTGLENDDIALANAIIQIPLNPDFSSLNLGQAVLLVAYEYCQTGFKAQQSKSEEAPIDLATQEQINGLVDRLSEELEHHNFFRTPEMKPAVIRNLHNLFSRTDMTDQEVRTFHGIISALIGNKLPVTENKK